jgi:hypothetical protein
MGSAKDEMFEEMERRELKKIRKEELMARLRYVEAQVRMQISLEKEFGYCHPDMQVARLSKSDAIKIAERNERARREEVLEKWNEEDKDDRC